MLISRDSMTWTIGMIGAIVVGVAANFSLFPWLPLWAQHGLTIAAFVIGIVSGKLATSPLPGAHEVAVAKALEAGEAPPIDPPLKAGSVDLTKIKPIFILVAALATFTPVAGCAKAPPALSPAGVTAYKAQDVVRALAVLRDAATAANAQTPPLISTVNTRKVIDFHEAAIKTINAVPDGWKPTVKAALDQLQRDILPAEWNRLLPYVSLIKTLIDGVAP